MPHGWSFSEFDHDETGKIENVTIIFPELLLENLTNAFPETRTTIAQIQRQKQVIFFESEILQSVQAKMRAMCSENDMEQFSSLLTILLVIAPSSETRVCGNRQKQSKGTAKMQVISRYMIQNYQQRITLDDAAKVLGMNRSSFCTFFRRERGKPFLPS